MKSSNSNSRSVAYATTLAAFAVCAVVIMTLSTMVYVNPRGHQYKEKHQEEMSDLGVGAKETAKRSERKRRQNTGIGDESQSPYEVLSSSLPTKSDKVTVNDRYMPTLGSGLIGTSVYGDGVYVNGLYNGKGGNSHRAKVPALVMARIRLPDNVQRVTRKYSLNVADAVFTETIDCDFALIYHRTYVHQRYIRVLVTDIYAKRKTEHASGNIFHLDYFELNVSSDFNFQNKVVHGGNWEVKGTTKEAEDGAAVQPVFIFFQERLRDISLRGSTTEHNETVLMSIDKIESSARADFDEALNQLKRTDGHDFLFQQHRAAWRNISNMGRVEVQGDLVVAKLVNLAQFYLTNNFPSLYPYQSIPYQDTFYGVGRTSLARGELGEDYQGHVFWDSEMYTIPYAILFQPEMVKRILRYRSYIAPAAKNYASRTGHVGYRYGWETAFSGDDVTPGTCVACKEKQVHVTAAVSWAIRQWYSATRDRDYLTNSIYSGCDVTREIARFFANMATYNTTKGRYDINGVMGPDDFQQNVSNNAYTNVMASLAIHWARYMACECQRTEREEVPDDWIQRALYLYLPFDNVKRVHYQYEGYERDANTSRIKQIDANLLGYPLNWNMSVDIMRNDLYYYEQKFHERTPAMTYSFLTVGWKWVNEPSKAAEYFRKSYQDYIIQPFKIWTEFTETNEADQAVGSVNFLPGMGGFMQSIVYGFAGIRIRPTQLEFHNPTPPPGCTKTWLRGLKYLGTNMTVLIDSAANKVTITVHTINTNYPLVLRRNGTSTVEELSIGDHTIDNPSVGFYIYTTQSSTCDPPRDYIYMYWGYSPWVSSSSRPQPAIYGLVAALISLCLHSWCSRRCVITS